MSGATTLFPELLRPRAADWPDHVALAVAGGPSLTYGEWNQRADAAGRALAAAGVRPGDRVALIFDNARWTDYAVAYLGTQRAGAAAVPLSPRLGTDVLTRVLAHAAPAAIVCAADVMPTLDLATVPDSGEMVILRPDDLHRADTAPFQAGINADDLAEIVYTSGTTGTPKGVASSHANLLAHDLPADMLRSGDASFAHAFPIGTNAGQECLRMPLRRLTTAYVLPVFDPERLCALIAERRVRRLQLVPAMAQMLVDSDAPSRHDVSSVDRITLSSAPAARELWARIAAVFPSATLWNAYALTEGGGARTLARYDPAHPESVGRPVGDSEVRIVDESGADVAAMEPGEIWLRRRGAPPRGYYRDPEATARAFAGDWLRTGDLGYLDVDGRLYLVDRIKDLIISGGLNISSVEIEGVLDEHPSVREAAVFGVPHPVLGQEVAAAVSLRSEVAARELQAYVRVRLGETHVPRRIEVVETLPRTDSGKVRKQELRDRFTPMESGQDAVAPASPAEHAVAAIWREVLGLDTIGVHDDFFALGGHSLAATQVVARLEAAYDTELPVTLVFEHPTIAETAAALAEALGRPIPA